jgi:two-component system LytT family response regulator
MKIRTLIVDDMMLARRRVRRYLESDPDLDIVGECSDGREAVDSIRTLKPDLVFLDVQMPEFDGFQVLEQLGEAGLPMVIFLTAYDHFAIKAFEVHALDYLLKPFDTDRLEKAVCRAKQRLSEAVSRDFENRVHALLKDVAVTGKPVSRLTVKTDGRTIFLQTDEIDWIEAAGNYLRIQAGKESHMIRERISQMETRLDPSKFTRIHRSFIVNIDRIKEMQPLFNGDQVVTLRNGKQLPMSRTYRDRLMTQLETQ